MPFRIRMGLPEMEARRFEEMDGAALKPFRRGWCLGSEEFKQKMLVQMGTSKSLNLMLLHWRHAHENANASARSAQLQFQPPVRKSALADRPQPRLNSLVYVGR